MNKETDLLSTSVAGIVAFSAGAILFSGEIVETFRPPVEHLRLLAAFLLLASLAMLFGALVLWRAAGSKTTHLLSTFSALGLIASVFCLASFIYTNLSADWREPIKIRDLVLSISQAGPGDDVSIEVEVENPNRLPYQLDWSESKFVPHSLIGGELKEGQPVSLALTDEHGETARFTTPDTPGIVKIRAKVIPVAKYTASVAEAEIEASLEVRLPIDEFATSCATSFLESFGGSESPVQTELQQNCRSLAHLNPRVLSLSHAAVRREIEKIQIPPQKESILAKWRHWRSSLDCCDPQEHGPLAMVFRCRPC